MHAQNALDRKEPTEVQCSACGYENPPDSKFCFECGGLLDVHCLQCQAPVPAGVKFCNQCGARLESPARGSSVQQRTPAPPEPAPAAEGERRQLTVLFCDLVGSTPLSQQLDAEEWRDVIAQYQQAARVAVERWGGHVAKNLGDGLLIYFGWPVAREDDPERAVRAGLAIIEQVAGVGSQASDPNTQHPAPHTRLAVRVGLHTGPVVIADGGEVFGETANVAARVQGAAAPDTVVLTAATQRLVAGLFVVEDRGPQLLKGVREAVTLYRVVRPSGVRSRLAVAAGHLTRFVGRDMELGTLVDRWERAQDGEGQNVIVLGEAGVGKSRLVYQLHEHLADVPHTWLECGATPYTEGTPFHPIITLVSQGLGFTPEDTAAEKLGKLEVGLRSLASTETVALLADFLGLSPPTRLQFSPELQRRKTIDLLAQWNLALSEVQPLVLLVEDLHWCDVSTLELLGHLIAQSPTARVLLLATARPEFTPPWPARFNLTTVQLARLTKRQPRDMIGTLAGTELPAATLDALVARADGVPLFVEELTKAVMEPGAAHGVKAIPASLADSLMARLDRLSAAKEVAQRAAVLGREFGYPLLAAMVGMDEAALRHGLARLVDAEILFAHGKPPAATYTFKHALIQETAYQSLLKRTRQQLHARVAQVLEERFPERVASEPEVVARHYDQAGLAAAATAHYQRAGERATQRSANEEAIGHLRRALALVGTLPETRERHQRELELRVALGPVLMATRGWSAPEVESTYARALELCRRVDDTPRLFLTLRGLWEFYEARGELEKAEALSLQLFGLVERSDDTGLLLVAHDVIADTAFWTGDLLRASEHCDRGVALHDQSLHRSLAFSYGGYDPAVACLCFASLVLWMRGYPAQALEKNRSALALARQLAQPFSQAFALYFAATLHYLRREATAARHAARSAITLCEEGGFPFYLALCTALHGWAIAELGEGDDGIRQIRSGLADYLRTGGDLERPLCLILLADASHRLSHAEESAEAVTQALAAALKMGHHTYESELYRLRGELFRAQNLSADSDAKASFLRAIEAARRQTARSWELRAATSLARFLRDQGKPDESRALLAPLYAWFTEGFDTRDLQDAKALLEEL
jgi:class 3 adenylate cyclase/predicted ATPase